MKNKNHNLLQCFELYSSGIFVYQEKGDAARNERVDGGKKELLKIAGVDGGDSLVGTRMGILRDMENVNDDSEKAKRRQFVEKVCDFLRDSGMGETADKWTQHLEQESSLNSNLKLFEAMSALRAMVSSSGWVDIVFNKKIYKEAEKFGIHFDK